jgi:hypothetical protein
VKLNNNFFKKEQQMNNAKKVNNEKIYEELYNDLNVLYAQEKFTDKYFQKPVEFVINSEIAVHVGRELYVENNGNAGVKFDIDEHFYKYFATISEMHFSKDVDFGNAWDVITCGNDHIIVDLLKHYKDDLLEVLQCLSIEEAEMCHLKFEKYILNEI